MNMCRTCLKTPADKDIIDLEEDLNEDNKTYRDIMLFCLDVKVAHHSKITTNLCDKCFRKIISFYKFKAVSLKNDAYLKSLNPAVHLVDKKLFYVDENGAKRENFLDPDVLEFSFGDSEDSKTEIKVEIDHNNKDSLHSDEGLQSSAQGMKYEYIEEDIKIEKAAPIRKKSASRKKKSIAKNIKTINAKHLERERQMCEECGVWVLNLAEHSIRHQPKDDRRTLRCKACPKLFCSQGGLSRHYKTSHLGIRVKCDICDKVYSKSALAAHKLRKHNRAALRFECVLCARRCASKSELDAHMFKHTKSRPFECDICHKMFSNKYYIATHIRQVHLNERNYQCELCSKAFFEKNALLEHLRTHTKELVFKCSDCEKSFWTKGSLRIHRISHSDVKNYHCDVCGRSFLRLGSLKGHMLSHTKEKPYPCRHCDARFGRSTHRNRHELTLHKKQLAND